MQNRRQFFSGMAAGVMCVACGARHAVAQTAQRREVMVGGRRVRTIDVHAHAAVPDVVDLVKGTAMERAARQQLEGRLGFPVAGERVSDMNKDGIDIQALSINAFWYGADRDMARRIVDLQDEKLAKMCAAYPDRFVGYSSVALQFPEIAAEQLERGMKQYGLRGAAIGGSVEGEELGSARFDPFWKKAEELQALIFIHPQTSAQATGITKRVGTNIGVFANVIGNPLETSLALGHLIFQGTLDKFPNLKICGAHGGGYLPSYAARIDHGCAVFPAQCAGGPELKKKPTDYLKQLYYDSLVFTPEGLRHLVAEHGASQVMIGTDYAVPWVKGPVDHVLNTPDLSDADRVAILGSTAAKLLKIDS